jgi:hypothetical protein
LIIFHLLFAEFYFNCFGWCTSHNSRTAYPPTPLGIFPAHKVTAARASTFEPATCSDFDSFDQTFVSFLFRHFTGTLKNNLK